ncbi:metal ABC transporter substrate-binding protein [Anaerospora hongkongensis]|uniref:metal ABC transporter substrate-binding protein n=1 Tax=Anaerospora hongkongensis TaxID=244830 RepID=UPI002FD8E87C
MFRKIVLLITLLFISLLLTAGCGGKGKPAPTSTAGDKIKVVATIYPVYEFAKQVGGDKIDLVMLIPPGAEPHEWEPTAKDLITIKSAKVFLYNGAGFEPVDKLLHKEVLGTAAAIEVSKGIPLLSGIEDNAEDDEYEGHDHDKQHAGHQHVVDPHVWLDPEYAKVEVNNIAQALSQVDPANSEYYRVNAEKYNAELTKLHEEFQSGLASAVRKEIVTTHAAFQYLAKRYKLQQTPIMGLSPDAEPTPDKMASIVRFCREKHVTTIFFETLVSPKLAETIAKETGAKLLVLNPIDGLTEDDLKQGKNYLSMMRQNLANLKQAVN